MNPDDPNWDDFCERLSDELDSDEHDGCHTDHRLSTAILATMNYDVPSSLAYFEQHGGGCDCEILLNVDPQPQ